MPTLYSCNCLDGQGIEAFLRNGEEWRRIDFLQLKSAFSGVLNATFPVRLIYTIGEQVLESIKKCGATDFFANLKK